MLPVNASSAATAFKTSQTKQQTVGLATVGAGQRCRNEPASRQQGIPSSSLHGLLYTEAHTIPTYNSHPCAIRESAPPFGTLAQEAYRHNSVE